MAATPIASEALEELETTVVASGNGYFEPNEPVGQTSWGQGEGLNGDILTPSDVDSLVDLLGKIEFKAEINTDDYIRYSNLNAGSYFFDDDTIEASGGGYFEGNPEGRSLTNIDGWAHEGDDWNGQSITQSNGSTVIEYAERTKDSWGSREFVRNLNNALQEKESSSGFIFFQPERFEVEGLLNTPDRFERTNPSGMRLENLAENSPLVIDISSDIADELKEIISNSRIEFDQSDFSALTSDFGDQGDINIKISDYLDSDGDIDIFALNSDVRLTLEIDNDAANKLKSFDRAWANVNLRSEPGDDGNQRYLHLNSGDHDDESLQSSHESDVTTYVETTDDLGTSLELTFREWSIEDAARNLEEGESSLKFNLSDLYASFETLGGYTSQSINGDQITQLTDSIQSITLDFSGYDPDNSDNDGDTGDIFLSINPLVDVIDLSSAQREDSFVDLELDGFEDGGFHTRYRLIGGPNQTDVGQFYMGGYSDNDSDDEGVRNHIHGHVYNEVDLSEITTQLDYISLSGRDLDGNWGDVSLEFNYDSIEGSADLSRINGYGWGEEYRSDDGSGPLPEFLDFNWEQFVNLEIINFDAVQIDENVDVSISTYLSDGSDPITEPPGDASILLSYNLYKQNDYLSDEPVFGTPALNQLAVLGDAVDQNSRFILDINAESLEYDYNIESTDVTIKFDPQLFGTISTSDIKIGGALPLSNAVHIDNDTGTIRLAAASLSDLSQGSGISGNEALASIALNFDENQIQYLDKNPDGSLKISPLTFDISVNDQETIFSNEFTDESGLLNREILTLDELGGSAAVIGQEVTLYEAKINLEQQGDGLVLGTERVIGADASYTNLVRKGDTLTTSTEWLNVGNIEANNLTYSAIYNQNATLDLDSASFTKESVASGYFVDGEFVEDPRESTIFTADINITGEAGNVVDLSDGIVAVHAEGTSEVFSNEGKGSSNLITFQGDLNYDGRVSMKDLAYLNAGAARQQDAATGDLIEDANQDGIVDASVASDVDADFSGKIDMADLSVLDNDWGKTLHTGDEDFQGSSDVSWDDLDSQGANTTWDNDSFKDQNAVEAEADYAGSLESPASTGVIGADGNDNSGDSDIGGTEFQDPVAV